MIVTLVPQKCIWGTFDLVIFKAILGLFQCTCYDRTTDNGACEIWDSLSPVIRILGTFDLSVTYTVLWSFGASVSKFVSQTILVTFQFPTLNPLSSRRV